MSAPEPGARVLLTGGRGFVGSRLTARLAARHPRWRLDTPAAPGTGSSGESTLDIADAAAVEAWVAREKPDIVVHLAAVAAVTEAVKDPRRAWDVNLGGTLNLVLALQKHAPDAHLMFVSSAEVYGASLGRDGAATDEAVLLRPTNPYAASKAAADLLVRQASMEGLSTVVMRPFNHTGPNQSEAFVAPAFAGQIARIEAGLQPPVLSVGSLDDERDFLDVEDVTAAYAAVLDHRDRLPGGEVFNVASGRAVRIGDLLETLLSQARVKIEVQVDPSRLRREPARRIVGDASRLQAATGWRPEIPFAETLGRLLQARRAARGLPA
jgi:GDP-4-dehydro-6-deoxy-D-mannose reductase